MSSDVKRWTSYILIVNKKSIKMFVLNLFKIFVLLSLVINVNNNNRLVLGDELGVNSDNNLDGHYSYTWAVHVDGDKKLADVIASEHGFINLGQIINNYYHFKHNHVTKRSLKPAEHHQTHLENDARVKWAKQQKIKSRTKRDFIRTRQIKSIFQLNDPKWSQMWYLNRGNNIDMNVVPAWREGITGKGVVVTILDDGLETDHPDLEQNYDPKASYDVNSHDEDPMPHYDLTDSNRHGTRCAGEVAATANNTLCAVGIAFGANVGGVRMLDGDVTDAVEARSLSLNPQHIDIYSASWGPDDDGKTVDGPGELATHAFIEGVTKGRNGKGSIFIWASGNGGREHDNCNCDGYTNSIWTLSISSATEEGLVPWYSEMCSSTLATTYSSGNQGEKQIVTTDLHHSCTSSHTGTSASAPLAAGIVALVLEANQNLTWRDLQHIVVRTAKPGNLRDPNWVRNGVGRRVSHSFGYGLMDAAGMVRLARTWTTVPEQQRCEINAPHLDRTIPPKSQITLQLTVQHCRGVNYLEHVQAKISLTSQRRGDIQIYLTSPAGTKVTLLTSRSHDVSRSGFIQWPFMSVHTWGEAPHGNWQLEIHNEGRYMGHAALKGWSLIFYGTLQPIDKNDPRSSTPIPPSSTNPYTLNNLNNYSTINLNSKSNLEKSGISNNSNNSNFSGNKNNNRNKSSQSHTLGTKTKTINGGSSSGDKKQKSNMNKNNNKNGRMTTPKPFSTTFYLSQKDRKYENNNFYNTRWKSSGLTTLKPKHTSKYQVDIKYQSNIYEKTPVKAPKQVKQTDIVVTTSATSSQIGITDPPNTNSNLPRMFQKYQKIQEFYPEFHPYTGSKVTSNPLITHSIVQSNGKPSRENSKFIFFSESDFHQSPSGLDVTQRKSSSSSTGVQQNSKLLQQQQLQQLEQKTGNAQITQWDLIFYGTKQPSQPDDPLQNYDKPRFNIGYGSGIEHNSLEFGSETASGQWRETHQVGESLDIQRSTTNESSGSICLHSSSDNKCLECTQSTYLYEGNCYMKCPKRTYLSPENSLNGTNDENSLQLSLRERNTNGKTLDTFVTQKICYACHATCTNCTGPFDYECTGCDNRSYLKIINDHEQYCLILLTSEPILETINNSSNNNVDKVKFEKENETSSNSNDSTLFSNNIYLYIFLLFASIGMILLFFCFIYIFKKIFFGQTNNKLLIDDYNYTYNPLKTAETIKTLDDDLSCDSELDEIIYNKILSTSTD